MNLWEFHNNNKNKKKKAPQMTKKASRNQAMLRKFLQSHKYRVQFFL